MNVIATIGRPKEILLWLGSRYLNIEMKSLLKDFAQKSNTNKEIKIYLSTSTAEENEMFTTSSLAITAKYGSGSINLSYSLK